MNVVIAQSDVVTAYGWGIDALWDGLLSGKTAIRSSDRFANRGFVSDQMALVPDLEIQPGSTRAMAMLTRILSPLIGKLDPQTSLILATTVGEIEFVERAILNDNADLATNARPHVLLGRIKTMLDLTSPAIVVSSACASSAVALTRAASLIRSGDAPAVLVVTVDSVSEFVYSGFSTLLSLCETPARPFDAERCGLSLGEAAAWALVTAADSPLADRKSPAILGWGSATDAVHMTAPDRAAGGLSRAIGKACTMADRASTDISFIAAHGTATVYNDAMELTAFRDTIRKPIPIFSIKGAVGHTLSSAGLVQTLVTARAMSERVLPATVGLFSPDSNAIGWARTTAEQLGAGSLALSTNSGFGGVNTAILLGASPAQPKSKPPILKTGIRAMGWFCSDRTGVYFPSGKSWYKASPPIDATREITTLIGRPVKYFPRMTNETRSCLVAAGQAMKALETNDLAPRQIGVIAAGYEGCLKAYEAYFRDYVNGGLSLGRANLFIYTLPTSAMGEVAIALSLTGPTVHLHSDADPVNELITQARRLIQDREADIILALWSDDQAAVCFAIDTGADVIDFPSEQSPLQMARSLAAKVSKG